MSSLPPKPPKGLWETGIPRLHILTFVKWTSITDWQSSVSACVHGRERPRGGMKRGRTEEHLCQCRWPFPEIVSPLLKLTPAGTEEGLDLLLFKSPPSFPVMLFGLGTYLSAHDSNSEHLHSMRTWSWEIWMPPVMDITLCLCVPCSVGRGGDVHTHEAHVTGWGSTERGSIYPRPPEVCPMAITERMKTCEPVQGKWVFRTTGTTGWVCLCLWISVCVTHAHTLVLNTQTVWFSNSINDITTNNCGDNTITMGKHWKWKNSAIIM